jgi:hypothetical protein
LPQITYSIDTDNILARNSVNRNAKDEPPLTLAQTKEKLTYIKRERATLRSYRAAIRKLFELLSTLLTNHLL